MSSPDAGASGPVVKSGDYSVEFIVDAAIGPIAALSNCSRSLLACCNGAACSIVSLLNLACLQYQSQIHLIRI